MTSLGRENVIFGSVTSLSVDGVNVGFTNGGVRVSKAKDLTEVELDQIVGVGKIFKSMERMFLETNLSEGTLANVKIAFDEPAANVISAGSQLDLGGNSSAVVEHTMALIGEGPNDKTRTFTVYIAVAVDEVEIEAGSRTEPGFIPVKFQLLKDPDQGYKFGSIVDIT